MCALHAAITPIEQLPIVAAEGGGGQEQPLLVAWGRWGAGAARVAALSQQSVQQQAREG